MGKTIQKENVTRWGLSQLVWTEVFEDVLAWSNQMITLYRAELSHQIGVGPGWQAEKPRLTSSGQQAAADGREGAIRVLGAGSALHAGPPDQPPRRPDSGARTEGGS